MRPIIVAVLLALLSAPAGALEMNDRGYVCQTLEPPARDGQSWLVNRAGRGDGSPEWQVTLVGMEGPFFYQGECRIVHYGPDAYPGNPFLHCVNEELGISFFHFSPSSLRFVYGNSGSYSLIPDAPNDGAISYGMCSPL